MTEMVDFDAPKRERLRKAHDAAVKAQAESFTFDGGEYLTAYAKYLLEYLDRHLPKR